ncbi:DNA-binding NtrC family response regulator (plasmid) [Ensifer sp. WSM1721]|uniref:response regulator n=1 Tax=Ensifer sp. WSM1721 TaxID=1041159 RepID=UPI00047ABFF4|nr:response regulator [Ensifer sp. WSM1721]
MDRSSEENQSFRGARILVAEDEILIALDIEATFRDAGAVIVGPCMTLSDALEAAKSESLSLAILDIRLGHVTTEDVTDLLVRRGIPFLFYSGQKLPAGMRKKCGSAILVYKPASQQELLDAAAKALAA